LRKLIDALTTRLGREGYVNLLRLATTVGDLEDTLLDLQPYAVVSFAPLADRARLRIDGCRAPA
jgi:hypothetical protein